MLRTNFKLKYMLNEGSLKQLHTETGHAKKVTQVLPFRDPNVFSVLRMRSNASDDFLSRSQNLAEILHGVKKYYQVTLWFFSVLPMNFMAVDQYYGIFIILAKLVRNLSD